MLPDMIRVLNLSSRLLCNKEIQKLAAPPLELIAQQWRGKSCVGRKILFSSKILCRRQNGRQDGDKIARRWQGEAWDLLVLLQYITKLIDAWPLRAGIFSRQPSPQQFFVEEALYLSVVFLSNSSWQAFLLETNAFIDWFRLNAFIDWFQCLILMWSWWYWFLIFAVKLE